MANYISNYTGAQLDEGIKKALGLNIGNGESKYSLQGYTKDPVFKPDIGAHKGETITAGAHGEFSISFGYDSSASGIGALAAGAFCVAQGMMGLAIGESASADGEYSCALGYGCSSLGRCSFSTGTRATAEGENSTAWGSHTKATGTNSMALGDSSVSKGSNSFAGGEECSANAFNTFAMGRKNQADGVNSSAFGDRTKTSESTEALFAVGKCNDPVGGDLFEVGDGSDPKNRSNAFRVLSDGRAKVRSAPSEPDDVVRKQEFDVCSILLDEMGRNHWNGKMVYATGDSLTLTDTLAPYYTQAPYYLTQLDVRKFYYPDQKVGSDFRLILPDFAQVCSFGNFASLCPFQGVLVLGNMRVRNWTLEMPFASSYFSAIELGEGKTMTFVNPDHKEIFYPFFNCPNLTRIGSSTNPFDFTGVTISGDYFVTNSTKLKEIHIKGIGCSLNISRSTAFEEADLVNILNNLAEVTETQTLTMGETNLAKLTDSEKEIATAKGWTLA